MISALRTWLLAGQVRRQIIGGSAGTLVLRAASLALGFLSTVLLSRALGATGYGVYAWAIAWASVLQLVASLGFDTLMIRELAAQRVTGGWAAMRGLLATGQRVTLFTSTIMALVCAGAGLALVTHQQLPTFLVALATVPALTLMTVREGALRGFGRIVASRAGEDLVRPIGLIVLLLIGWGVFSIRHTAPAAMALQAGATVIASVASWGLLRRATPDRVLHATPVKATARWIGHAVPLVLLRAINTLLSQIDVILVGILRNPTQVALYATATRFAGFVGIAEFAVNAAFLPVASRLFASGETARLGELAPLVALGGVILSAALAAPMILFATPILHVFGQSFSGGASSLRILSISFVVSAICGQSLGLLTMTRNVRQVLLGSGAALISNVILNLLFVPTGGAHGAAVAWLLSVIVWNVILALQVHRSLKITSTPLALIPRMIRRGRRRHAH